MMKQILLTIAAIGMLFTATAQMVGGPCTYTKYPGKAKITKVEKTDSSKGQRGLAPYEGYEVKFVFTPAAPVSDKLAAEFFKREWTYFLIEGAYEIYPGEQYIKKYDIKTGKEYDCTMSVIKTGTCTPWAFVFKGLDPKDLFESESGKNK